MPVRSSTARWDGSIGDGTGNMRVGSAWEGSYSAASRFESGEGTNPEELVGAAHAGCYSMFLAAVLTRAGTPPTKIETTADVHIEKVNDAWEITRIDLSTEGEVPGIDDATFQDAAENAKANCPVSKALRSVSEVNLTATLTNG